MRIIVMIIKLNLVAPLQFETKENTLCSLTVTFCFCDDAPET